MALVPSLLFLLAALLTVLLRKLVSNHRHKHPISVNYHFTRRCNKSCGFCFHTATTSYKESAERAKEGLRLLQISGMRKLNFAGGEPFLYQKFLGEMVKFCKEELKLESVSIVTNGSLVTERFLAKFGQHIDILAVSCDSFKKSSRPALPNPKLVLPVQHQVQNQHSGLQAQLHGRYELSHRETEAVPVEVLPGSLGIGRKRIG